jgi:hypothetical protein
VDQVWETGQDDEEGEGMKYGSGKVGKEVKMNHEIELEASLIMILLTFFHLTRDAPVLIRNGVTLVDASKSLFGRGRTRSSSHR